MATKEKAADEIYCRSCGEPIKKEAEICPNCGVRNEKASAKSSSTTTPTGHDPDQFTTTVSDTWWYGIVAGTVGWILVLGLSSTVPNMGAVAGFLVLIVWIGLPVSAYFDMQYVRANAEWNPSTALWVILLAIWLVNIIAGGVYLYRRHEVLGEP